MNDQARQFGVLVGGLSIVAAAAWFTAVKPLMVGLAEDRARLDSDVAEIHNARANFDSVQTQRVIEDIRQHTEAYSELWQLGADASALYDRFQALALDAGVRIERVEPKHSGVALRNKSELHELEVEAAVTGYKVDVLGDFDAVVRFVRALQTRTGLTRVDSVRMAPAASPVAPGWVEASVQTTHASLASVLAPAEPKGGR